MEICIPLMLVFIALHMQHFLFILTMTRNSNFVMVEPHLYPFDTFVETIDIFSNCCAQDVEYIKVVKISIVCPWFN